ncbi:uncharacterized protein LOC105837060 isoform X2 [Monomorium pharaonis]|uniref:uncharacterized protein LOC105837060 isoform X2 n=1 Tax=Monomorium pharaonis TaxID=307658 RepID=UPI00102E1587|nr:uncharacterized protein LOC105837060 isoform X2 [Monomorium pharaonis]
MSPGRCSSPWHHTANMKLLLFTFVVCFAAALAAPADKQKRDILPGDPRYGTEHHHHHHEHHENENEVQISKAAGGYIGSYTVPDDTVPADQSFQVQPQPEYGLPNHTPGKPLVADVFESGDADKNSASLLVPSTSYGIPDTVQTTVQEQPKFDTVHLQKTVIPEVHHVQQPAVVQKHVEIPHVSLPQVKVSASHLPTETQGAVRNGVSSYTSVNNFPNHYAYSSYGNLPVKTIDHHVQVQVPQPYHVPVTKHVAVPVPVPHTVEIPKPYYVRVPQPVQVTVDRPYPVEVPRPVPYPVHHYVKTGVPVAHHVVATGIKANPFQTFFDNTQSTFQNVFAGLPTFSNPLESFPNPFENGFDISSIPGISFIPGPIQSLIPQQIPGVPTPEPSPVGSDSVAVENPALKTETTVTKTSVQPTITHIKTVPQGYKPTTACAGCTVTSASSKQEYVQPTDANGGYVY